jgi:hypothetical protein
MVTFLGSAGVGGAFLAIFPKYKADCPACQLKWPEHDAGSRYA